MSSGVAAINDGFLTPFKVKQIQTTLNYYVYTPDDTVVEGEIKAGKVYEETDFNRNIEIRERERKRVEIFMSQINQHQKRWCSAPTRPTPCSCAT